MMLQLLMVVVVLPKQPASEEKVAQNFGRALEEWHAQVVEAAAETTNRIRSRALKSVEI